MAIAVFGNVQRFASAKHAPSYAGLVPGIYQSGACDRHGHITKRAFGRAPSDARPPTTSSGRPIRSPSFVQEPVRRRGYKTAIVAVAHRLCQILYAPLRSGTEFQP